MSHPRFNPEKVTSLVAKLSCDCDDPPDSLTLMGVGQSAPEENETGLPVPDEKEEGMIGLERNQRFGHWGRSHNHDDPGSCCGLCAFLLHLHPGLVYNQVDPQLMLGGDPLEICLEAESSGHAEALEAAIQAVAGLDFKSGESHRYLLWAQALDQLYQLFRVETFLFLGQSSLSPSWPLDRS
jgi:hypothetical protein